MRSPAVSVRVRALTKTNQIESEWVASLGSVTSKIDAEEADINAKAQENEELRVKLEQFKGHLELRREPKGLQTSWRPRNWMIALFFLLSSM